MIRYIFREFDTFCAKFQKNKEYFNKLLSTFKDDVEHLKKTPLHPKLQTSTKKTLLDSLCDSDTKLIGYHQKCKDDFSKLHAKIEEGTKSKKEIQKEVSTRLSNLKTTPPLGINLDRLKSIKEEMEKSIENQKSSILVSIEKGKAIQNVFMLF